MTAGLCKELTAWRNGSETPWLKDASVHPLQQTLKDLERAYAKLNIGATKSPTSTSIKMLASLINNSIAALHGADAPKLLQWHVHKLSGLRLADVLLG